MKTRLQQGDRGPAQQLSPHEKEVLWLKHEHNAAKDRLRHESSAKLRAAEEHNVSILRAVAAQTRTDMAQDRAAYTNMTEQRDEALRELEYYKSMTMPSLPQYLSCAPVDPFEVFLPLPYLSEDCQPCPGDRLHAQSNSQRR